MSPSLIMFVLFVKISDSELRAQTVIDKMDKMLTVKTKPNKEIGSLDVLVDVTLAVNVLETVEHLERDGAGRFHGEPITL